MGNENIEAEVYVEQIRDGWQYKGHIDFQGVCKLTYEFLLPSKFEEFDKEAEQDSDSALQRVNLRVRNQRDVDVTQKLGDGRNLVCSLTIPLAYDLYNSPQTKDANKTYLAGGTGNHMLKDFGARASIGLEKKVSFTKNQKLSDFFTLVA